MGFPKQADMVRSSISFVLLVLVSLLPFSAAFAWNEPYLVKNISSNPSADSNLGNLVELSGNLYFSAKAETSVDLWKTDGTALGTTMIKTTGAADITDLRNLDGMLYFVKAMGSYNMLSRSDGTTAGTVDLKFFTSSIVFAKMNGDLYVSGTVTGSSGLWRIDGAGAAVLVKSILAGPLVNVNGDLLFTATDANGTELWKSDGTAEGTVLLKDIYPGSGSSNPSDFTEVNGTLYFKANGGAGASGLWKSDGTTEGTVLVKALSLGTDAMKRANVNGTLFFAADGGAGMELWKSNGTLEGAVLVKDIFAGSGGSNPANLTNLNGTLYFSATTSATGTELWKSDGTEAGTMLVKDINPGSGSSNLSGLATVNGTLYFAAVDSVDNGIELWKSDGTESGTAMVKDIYPGTGSSGPSKLSGMNRVLYFSATDGVNGRELWALNTIEPAKIGVYQDGYWYLDANQSWDWNGTPVDILGVFGIGLTGAVPVVGVWTDDGTARIGVYIDGIWYLDMNNNCQWDGEDIDVRGVFGIGLPNAIPVVGDWNGDGKSEIGIYSNGNWYLDKNRSWAWEGEPGDTLGLFGTSLPNVIPVTGDWNGDGTTEIGVYSEGNWYLDKNQSWQWDGVPADTYGLFGVGLPNVIPVTGDWSGDGVTEIGVYSEGNWYLDKNQSWQWDGTPTDTYGLFGTGLGIVVPVTGNWLSICGGGKDSAPNIQLTDSTLPFDDHQLTFESVQQGSSSDQTVTVANTGTADLVIGEIANTNSLAAPFSITADTCSHQTVAPSGTCTVTVRFSPSAIASFNDSFDIPSNDPDTSTVTITVTGTGIAVPVPNIAVTDSVAPDNDLQISFGSVAPGSMLFQILTVANTGTANLVIGEIANTNSLAAPFSITADTCSHQTVAPSGTCTVTVRFSPSAIASFNDSFDIPSNDPEEATVTVSVNGAGITASNPAINVPDTGQTSSYTTTFGEDHDYNINPPSYAENETGIITDNVTGLMWLKCPAGLGGSACGAGSLTAYNWYEASGTAHATHNPGGALNACRGTILGYSDWRLPTAFEAVTIVHYSRSDPSINTTYFPGNVSSIYWTSTDWIASSTWAWTVDFYVGQDVTLTKESRMWAVRCVRGQQPISLLQDNGDETITDNATGLIWQKQDDNVKKDWLGALNYCETSTLAGNTDWRLPNAKELSSIMDRTRRNPAIDPVFTNTKSNYYWTSTTVFEDNAAAWIGTFYGGGLNNLEKKINVSGYIRCVRN